MSETSKPEKPESQKHGDLKISGIFWGLLFILIGGMVLANNFDIVDVDWSNLWRLWPLIIISIGISMLSIRSIIGKVLSIVFSLFVLAAIAWVMIGGYPFPNNSKITTTDISIEKESSAVKKAELYIKTGASSLKIDSAEQSRVASVELKSNAMKLSETSKIKDGLQSIEISTEARSDARWMSGDFRSDISLTLTRDLPLSMTFDIGATSSKLDFSGTKLTSATFNAGASSIDMKIGSKEALVYLELNAGASSIDIRVPDNSGVKLSLDSGMTSTHLADLTKTGENLYESKDYEKSTNKVNIVGKLGVSTIRIIRY